MAFFMLAQLPPHVVRQGKTYYFRILVPFDLQQRLNKKELRYSLKTSSIDCAATRAKPIAFMVKQLFKQLRQDSIEMNRLSTKELQELVQKYIHITLDTFEMMRITQPAPWEYNEDQRRLYHLQEHHQRDLVHNDLSVIQREAVMLLENEGIRIPTTELAFKEVSRELLKSWGEIARVNSLYDNGIYDPSVVYGTLESKTPSSLLEINNTAHQPHESVPLTSVIEDYTKEQLHSGQWEDKTKRENHACYQLFLDFAGHEINTTQITYPLLRDYKAALMNLPPNMRKAKAYREKSIKELLEMDIKKTMSTTTINKYLNRLSTLLKYAVKNGWMTMNPAEGMQLPEDRRDDELRAAFTLDDLKKLFHSPHYIEDTHKHPYQFWVLPIALFTGMRQNEIAQLHLDDILQDDGLWVFDINANTPDKHIKTKNSKRRIPMHTFLTETLNLPGYVQRLRERGEQRLFPEISSGRDRYGQTISRWYNGNGSTQIGYKGKCGVVAKEGEPLKDFHSFRHTLIDHLKQKLIDKALLHELDGHAHKSMSLGKYGKQYSSHILLDHAIAHIDFHKTVDLAHLAKSKHVKRASSV